MDIETLLARAHAEHTPLIDGEVVTFIWRGDYPPQLTGDWTNWQADPAIAFAQVAADVWTYTTTFPQDAYLEYSFVNGAGNMPDVFNPRRVHNGLGSINQFFYMPAATPAPLARRPRSLPRGCLMRTRVETGQLVTGEQRQAILYQPPTREPVPLLVVLDGMDYARRARLPILVDNLIAQQRIRPLALAFIQNAGSSRFTEYACNDSTLDFILSKVLPLARERLKLLDIETNPGAFGILGASLGGLMAMYAGLRVPHIFGHVLSQSGGFTISNQDTVVYDLVAQERAMSLKLWLDVGRYERLLETNRRMHTLLRGKGYDVTYREYSGGHNYTAWRDEVWTGLETVFGVNK